MHENCIYTLLQAVIEIDEDEPLPKPFHCQLPLDLELELKSNNIVSLKTVNRVAKFVSQKMFGYSRKVSKADRERVAQHILNKYPLLGSTVCIYMYDAGI